MVNYKVWIPALLLVCLLSSAINVFLYANKVDHRLVHSRSSASEPFRRHGGAWAAQPGCADIASTCEEWHRQGLCLSRPSLTVPQCAHTCSTCLQPPLMKPPWEVEIAGGVMMPALGFGTAGLGENTVQAVKWALEAGYTLIDTAQAKEWYREDLVGQAIQESGVPRSRLFLTSKLHPRHHGYASAAAQIKQSLKALRTDRLDLFLLHYPECWEGLCGARPPPEGTWRDSWRALEDAVLKGTVRAIGVSNFDMDQLAELLLLASRVRPALVQRNSDPFSSDRDTRTFCAASGIQYQGYSTLGTQWQMRGMEPNPVLNAAVVEKLAMSHKVSNAQLVLRWALQSGQAVIPMSSSAKHIAQNRDVFTFSLSAGEMQQMDELDGTLSAV